VLFVRSGVPLVYGTAWYRAHTHITALTPVATGREILGGTFTHPSPVAAFFYRGDASPRPITRLAEQLDGHSLFGQPLERVDAGAFDAHARRFRIAAVVALEEDAPRLAFLDDPARYRRVSAPPFVVFAATAAPRAARTVDASTWDVSVAAEPDGWAPTGMTYSSLWRAELGGRPLPTRRSAAGDLEVQAGAAQATVRLAYRPGVVELGCLAVSALGVLALAGERVWRRYWRRA